MPETIFDKILKGEIKSWKVWEDDKHIAFLTPFPNTPGQTIVIPKENKGDYVFSLSEEVYSDLLLAAKKVAKILEKAFNTPRIAMVFEGTGVAYVHAKLYPLCGKLASETDVWSSHKEFYPEYVGYLTTVEGPKMSDQELDEIQQKILKAQQS
ncbi:HIT family protein [Candidatus Microgenomates bacterium]|jgi:beta-aspartyl-peptidase (threonine type)|nr:MAG: HIT family protein [Candidatus Microgenomates bacterium]